MAEDETEGFARICSALIACGFKENAAKLYTALSTIGIGKVSELHALTEIPRSKIYEILERLERAGFVVRFGEKPASYIALDGTDALIEVAEAGRRKYADLLSVLQSLHNQSNIEPSPGTFLIKREAVTTSRISFLKALDSPEVQMALREKFVGK